ncbi:MAG: amidohydrolase family protein [Hyphomicrobiales bacterium]|nr:amidohydrolase family protein [Hyphomicrobiales bacterium]
MVGIVDKGFFGSCFICGAACAGDEHRPASTRRTFLASAVAAPAAIAATGSGLFARSAAAQTAATPAPPRGTYLLAPDWTLAWTNGAFELIRDASIIIRGDIIEDIRRGPVGGDLPRRPLPGQIVMPGFISGHTHVCSASPTRGIIEGGRSFARPLELVETLSDDDMDALTAYNLAELLVSGCTTQVEMSLSLRQAQSYARVGRAWGARGYVGGMIPGIARLFPIWFRRDDKTLTDSVAATLQEVAANVAFGRELKTSGNGRLLPMMAPHATDTHTPETMAAILAGAREFGTGLHIHLSQSARETETVKRLWGATPTQWLENLGFFDMPVFGAHLTGIDPAVDLDILKKHGAVYAHCPSGGGAGGGGGIQPYVEALAAGVATNIGIDTHSNDYVENLKLAVIVGRTRARMLQAAGSKQPVKMPTIWSAIEGATVGAANGLRRPDLGRIEKGAKADLVSIDVSGFLVGDGATPPEPLNHLLYAHGSSVRDVIIDGVYKVAAGRLVVDDEAAVVRKGGEVAQKIWRKLADENWFTPTAR